jgi:hypothetical protein
VQLQEVGFQGRDIVSARVSGPRHHAGVDPVIVLIHAKHAPCKVQHGQFLQGVLVGEFHDLLDALDESDVGEDRAPSVQLSHQLRLKRADCAIDECPLDIGPGVSDGSKVEVGEQSGNHRQSRQDTHLLPNRLPLIDRHGHVKYFGGG